MARYRPESPEEAAVTRLATEVAESSQPPQPARVLGWVTRHATILTLLWYVAGGFWVTARLWIHPSSLRQPDDPQDVNQATWFMRYTAHAVEHWHLPALITTAMNAPHSVNLMWNTSLLLPGVVVTPITAAFGPQVSLTSLLVIGFAGSAASMYFVLRRWDASPIAAALGGALYGFSPALVDSGIGHYSLVLAILPPLMLDRVIRLVTGRGSAVRNGLWLGLFVAAQLFISEELLVDTVIAAVLLLVVLGLCRPREIVNVIRPLATGLACAVVVAGVLSARGLWVQFHGVEAKTAAATVIINYPPGTLTNLGTLPYAFINPADFVIMHAPITARIAGSYPQPLPEYLAYLGVPLIILLVAAIIFFWRVVAIRVAGITCILLEWLGMGAQQLHPHSTLPGWLLPWQALQHLPVIGGMVPDRLCILADAAAAVVLAFALDRARNGEVPFFAKLKDGPLIATGLACLALFFVVPSPYAGVQVNQLPAGWTATFESLHLPDNARVLVAPFPYSGESEVMRWQADTDYPRTMIGGDFIAPNQSAHNSRAGRSAMTKTSYYIDNLYDGTPDFGTPSTTQIHYQLAAWQPNAVVAVTTPTSSLGKFLIKLFGQPTTEHGQVLGWQYKPGVGYGS
jgi:hypothetical protein